MANMREISRGVAAFRMGECPICRNVLSVALEMATYGDDTVEYAHSAVHVKLACETCKQSRTVRKIVRLWDEPKGKDIGNG